MSKRSSPSSSAEAPSERLGPSRYGTSRRRDFHSIKFRPAMPAAVVDVDAGGVDGDGGYTVCV